MGGIIGAILITVGVIFTAFFIILFIAKYLEKYRNNRIVEYLKKGLQPVIIGLLSTTIISLAITVFFPDNNILYTMTTINFWKSIVIFIIALIMSIKKFILLK